jgi:murein L,D-transpeptidase YcbB/YkuD
MIPLPRQAAFAAVFLASALLAGAAGGESPTSSPEVLPAQSASQAPAESLSPAAESLRTELVRQRGPASAEQRFYEARQYAPLWLADDGSATPAAQALINWANAADINALPVDRYGVAGLAIRLGQAPSGAFSDAAGLEIALTRLFLTYGRAISSGLLEPQAVNSNIDVEPRRPDPTMLLARMGSAANAAAFLDTLIPSDPAYDRLVTLYADMRDIVRNGDWGAEIDSGESMRLGDRGLRIEQLRARLIAIGDMTPTERIASTEVRNDAAPVPTDPRVFDPALEAAVRRFQDRHGLNTDGTVGAQTLKALNTSAAERAEQVAVNLERLRWMNYDLGWRHILVNTAAFTMTMIENSAPRFTTRTVVGKSGKFQTPEFNDHLEFIVVNPTWNVPYSIATNEILPELQKDPTYLEQNNMELLDSDLPSSLIDWSQVTRRNFPGRIRQRPGLDNALGSVKFLFPNKYSIYMHDTPSRKLFARDRRDYSHGCVRLENPAGFAHLLLSLQNNDPVGTFERLRDRGGERWVTIEEQIPVYVTYRTAWLDSDGVRHFRADVYERDRDVVAAMTAAGVSVIRN